MKKIKDLEPGTNLKNIKFRTPDDQIYYWQSQWSYEDGFAGIWGKKDLESNQIFPIFLDKLSDALEFEIIEE